jgi:ABC-2 type transport system ATP-binding protein
VADPSLLLLDEPTTGLDPEQRAGVRSLLGSVNIQRTTVISSHVMEDIEALAQDLVVIDGGQVLFHGPLEEFVGPPERRLSAEQAFLALISRRRSP